MTNQRPQEIGARLRSLREQSSFSLRQIADATKLSVRVLESLERGQIDQLPGGIYRRAVVRAYASEIGLDPEETLREFLAQYPDDLPAPPGPKPPQKDSWGRRVPEPAPPARRRFRLGRVLLSIVGALVPLIAGLYYFSATRTPDVHDRSVDPLPSPAVEEWHPAIVPAGGFVEAPVSMGRSIAVVLTISSACQLEVVADGRVVLSRRVQAGELLQLELSRELELLGDNAAAVQFSINGRGGRRLGEAAAPLRARITRDTYSTWLVQP